MILYSARFKKDNIGDLLINVLLIKELANHRKVMVEGVLPKYVERLIGTNENVVYLNKGWHKRLDYPVVHWIALLPYLSSIKYVFGVPGHAKITGSTKSMLRGAKNMIKAMVLKLLGKKFIMVGVTLEYSKGMAYYLTKKMSKSYSLIAVRDKQNFEQLKKAKISNIKLIDDLALLYKRDDFVVENSLLVKKRSNSIVISFRWGCFGSGRDDVYFSAIKNYLFENLNRSEFKDTHLVFCFQVIDDRQSVQELYQLFAATHTCELIDEMLTLDEAINLYSTAEWVLTNRLHVALLAMVNNTPAMVVTDTEQHTKASNVYTTLGLQDLIFDIQHRALSKSVHVDFSKILERRNELKSFFKSIL